MTQLLDPVTGPITRKQLQAFAESPIDNAERAAKIFIPAGKRTAPRSAKPVYENEFAPAVTPKEVRARRDAEKDKKLGAILTYYASTDIPFERIAAHTKLDMVTVIRVMKQRGREQ